MSRKKFPTAGDESRIPTLQELKEQGLWDLPPALLESAGSVIDVLAKAVRRVLCEEHAFPAGHYMYFRCVTYHYVGKIERVLPYEVLLSNPVWVADSGKWQRAYETGELTDYMHGPDYLLLGRLSIVDAGPWTAAPPKYIK